MTHESIIFNCSTIGSVNGIPQDSFGSPIQIQLIDNSDYDRYDNDITMLSPLLIIIDCIRGRGDDMTCHSL